MRRVLLLEDDATDAVKLDKDFTRRGCEVVLFDDAEAAFFEARTVPFDVVVVSADLAGEGVALSQRLKGEAAARSIPLFIVSRQPAAAGVLRKAVAVDALLARLGGEAEEPELLDDEDVEEVARPAPPQPRPSTSIPGTGDPREVIKNLEKTIAALRRDLSVQSQAVGAASDKRRALDAEVLALREGLVAVERQLDERAAEVDLLRVSADASRDREEETARRLDEALTAHDQRAAELLKIRAELEELTRARAEDMSRHVNELVDLETQRFTEAANAKSHRAEDREDRDRAVATAQRLEVQNAELEADLARTKTLLTDAERKLEAAERDAIKDQLARDEALADALTEARRTREELERAHAQELDGVRDKAVSEALRVFKRRAREKE